VTAPLLELADVHTHFPVNRGIVFKRRIGAVRAVDGVSLSVQPGETLGLVGESGCGKSTLARTIVRLARITSGSIRFEGQDLAALSDAAFRPVRRELQMIFQDPYASLNPRRTVFDTLAEPLRVHSVVPRADQSKAVAQLMERVGLARRLVRKYPHEFSGGQRQRIAIARALALSPKLILADEPVSALDVSVQAQILNLLQEIHREMGLTLVLIAHDLAVVRHVAHRIAVMYLGRIVEIGDSETVFTHPQHPYTRALVSAIPHPDPVRERKRERLIAKGDPPSPSNPPAGCPFHPRCPFAVEACKAAPPPLVPTDTGQEAACIRLDEIGKR